MTTFRDLFSVQSLAALRGAILPSRRLILASALACATLSPAGAQSVDLVNHLAIGFSVDPVLPVNLSPLGGVSYPNGDIRPSIFRLYTTKQWLYTSYDDSGSRLSWFPLEVPFGNDISLGSSSEVSEFWNDSKLAGNYRHEPQATMAGTRNSLFYYETQHRVRLGTITLSLDPSGPLFQPAEGLMTLTQNKTLVITRQGIYLADNFVGRLLPLVTATGSGPGELAKPTAVNMGPDGLIYVLDSGNNAIKRYDFNTGEFRGEFALPTGLTVAEKSLAISSSGRIYLDDGAGGGVVLTLNGELIETFQPPSGTDWTVGTVPVAADILGNTGVGSYLYYDMKGNVFTYLEGSGIFQYRDADWQTTSYLNLNLEGAMTTLDVISPASGTGASFAPAVTIAPAFESITFAADSVLTVTNTALIQSGNLTVASGTATVNGAGTLLTASDGGMTKLGEGKLILANNNTYTGGTTVTAGVLQLGNGGTTGSITGDVALADGTNLAVDRSNGITLAGVISGGGSLTQLGSGTLTLTGTNTYTGGTTVTGGLINFSSLANFGTGNITLDGGGLQWATGNTIDLGSRLSALGSNGGVFDTNGNDVTLASVLSGSGALTKSGSGVLTLTNANTYTAGTTVTGGLINFTTHANLSTGNITLDGGGLQWATGNILDVSSRLNAFGGGGGVFDTNGNDITLASVLSGSGALTKSGSGTLTLTNANTYSGGTAITGGQLTMDNAAALGSGLVSVASGATLDASSYGFDLNRLSGAGTITTSGNYTAAPESDITLTTSLAGTASLTKSGAATLTLTGTNTYTGGTTINAGLINFSSLANFGTGNITLDGGGLQWTSGTTTDVSSQLNPLGSAGTTFDTNSNNVTLASVLSGPGALTKSGSGTLTLTNANTYTGGTTVTGGFINFSTHDNLGTGNITLDGGGLQWATGNTLDVSSRLAALGSNGGVFDTNGNDITLASVISGSGALTKYGSGTLTLTNANTYAGGTAIIAGQLTMGNAAALGSGSVSVASGSTLDAFSYGFDLNRLSGAGTITTSGNYTAAPASDVTLATHLAGTASLTKSGAATLTLTGTNTYTGGTTVNAGLINFSSLANFGTGNITLDGGGLQWTSGTTTDVSSQLNPLASAGATFDTNGNNVTLASVLSGSGTLTKSGSGTLTLGASNTYTGGTAITAGQLTMGNAAALGSGSVTVANGATLDASGYGFDLNHLSGAGTITSSGTYTAATTTDSTVATNLAGTASLIKTGAARLTLTGANTYSGGTTVNDGLIQFSSLADFGTGNITLDGGGLRWATGTTIDVSSRLNPLGSAGATFDTNGNNVTLASALSGSGALTKSGSGALTLGATNTYTGGTFLKAGTLNLNANDALGSGAITITGGGLRAGGAARTLTNALFTSGSFTVGRSITFAGAMTLTGATTIIASNPDGLANADTTFSGPIGGNFGVTLAEGSGSFGIGSGYIVFSGANTYTGGTTLTTRLSINNDAALGATSGALTMDGGNLRVTNSINSSRNVVLAAGGGTFDIGGATGFSGTLSGVGALTKSGTGTLTLTDANTYTGGTTINSGTLALSGAGTLGSGALNLNNGATLDLGGTTQTVSGIGTNGGLVGNITAGTLGTTGDIYLKSGTFANTWASGRLWIGGDANATVVLNGTNDAIYSADHNQVIIGYANIRGLGTFIGAHNVGTVKLGNANALAAATENVQIWSGTLDLNGQTGVRANSIQLFGRYGPSLVNNSTDSAATYAGGVALLTLAEIGGGQVSIRSANLGGEGALTLSGVVSGFGSLIKVGAGALTLSGVNTYTSGTTITGGLINFASLANFGTGNITLDGGGLQWASGNQLDASSRLNALGGGGGVFDTNGNDVTLASALSGSGALTKSGSGTLTLTNANTYAGGTAITGGQLTMGNVAALGSGSVSVASDATLDASSYGFDLNRLSGAGTITTSGNYTLATTSDTTVAMNLAGTASLTKTGAATLTLTGASTYSGGTSVTGGLINFSSLANFGTGNVTLDGSGLQWATGTTTDVSSRLNALGSAGATFDTNGNNVTLASVLSGSGALTKSGSGTLTLTNANTYSGGTPVNAGLINFSSLANFGTGNITLDGGGLQWASGTTTDVSSRLNSLGAAGATFDTNGNNVTLASVLSGSGALTKSGSGTLTLTHANTYAGGTAITAGQLTMGNAAALGSGSVSVASGSTLDASSYGFDLNRLSGAGTITTSGNYTAETTSNTTVATNLAGTASLIKTGAARLTLTGNNTYSGGTTVNAGLIKFSSLANFGTGFITLDGGGLRWATGTTTDVSSRLNPLGSAGATFDTNGNNVTLASTLSGSGALTKSGAGTLTLGATNTYSGGTFVKAGTLELYANDALGTGAITITGGGLRAGGTARTLTNALVTSGSFTVGRSTTFAGAMTLTGATTIIASNPDGLANADTTFSGPISGNFGVTLAEGSGSLGIGSGYIVFSGANTYTGGTTLTTRLSINNDAALGATSGALTMDGGRLRVTNSTNSSRNVVLASGGTFDISGATGFSGTLSGVGALTKSGTGTLTLTNANTYSGGTAINEGTLALSGAGKLGGGTLTLTGGATLDLGGTTQTVSGIGSSGNGLVGNITGGTLVTSNTIYLTSGTFSNTWAAGRLWIGGDANATVVLNGTNDSKDASYNMVQIGNSDSGAAGTVKLGNANALSDATEAVYIWSGTLDLNGQTNVRAKSINLESGSASYLVNNATGSAATYAGGVTSYYGTATHPDGTANLGGAGALTLSGTLSGEGSFTKVGAGTLTLTAANTYTGFTSVNDGTLVVNGSLANTTVTVATGATLGGGGSIQGFTTIQSGARVAPGNSPGTITFTSGLTLEDGAILDLQLGAASDMIRVSGGILSGPSTGTITVNLSDSGGFGAGTYTLIDATDATLSSIGATAFELGTTIAGYTYTIVQNGNVFELIAVSAVPEPSAYAALAGLAVFALSIRRRRARLGRQASRRGQVT